MKLAILSTLAVASMLQLSSAAHLAACTQNLDGSGPYDKPATQACCRENGGVANINGYYSETYGDCRTGIDGGNSVNAGAIAACCSDLNKGTTSQ